MIPVVVSEMHRTAVAGWWRKYLAAGEAADGDDHLDCGMRLVKMAHRFGVVVVLTMELLA
jgi:hypothetical protein